MQIGKKKRALFYFVWIVIISYLFFDFLKSDPFGKNSAFGKATCHKNEDNSQGQIEFLDIK